MVSSSKKNALKLSGFYLGAGPVWAEQDDTSQLYDALLGDSDGSSSDDLKIRAAERLTSLFQDCIALADVFVALRGR